MQEFARKEIGQRIAQARLEAGGMTQQELADLVGVTSRSIQAYEAGEIVPWKHFERISEVLDREMGWFLHGDRDEGVILDTARFANLMARLEVLVERLEAAQPPDEQ